MFTLVASCHNPRVLDHYLQIYFDLHFSVEIPIFVIKQTANRFHFIYLHYNTGFNEGAILTSNGLFFLSLTLPKPTADGGL